MLVEDKESISEAHIKLFQGFCKRGIADLPVFLLFGGVGAEVALERLYLDRGKGLVVLLQDDGDDSLGVVETGQSLTVGWDLR